VSFGIQQLVEIALRALSPGVNEPFTAMTCIDRLRQTLMQLASRRLPSAIRIDAGGRVRVVTEPRQFPSLLTDALEPLGRYGSGDPAIAERLLTTLDRVAAVAQRADDLDAIARVADVVWSAARRDLKEQTAHARLARLYEAVRHSVAHRSAESRAQPGAGTAR
jgi:uncharacterized membrane protein